MVVVVGLFLTTAISVAVAYPLTKEKGASVRR
jgi:hypothetical protein